MAKRINWNKIGWSLIYLIIIVNVVLLYQVKRHSLGPKPLEKINMQKPTLVVVFNENECISCIEGLFFLNDLHADVKEKGGKIDFLGIVLSKEKTDRKGIAKAFVFPFLITDDFNILNRLNIDRSPLVLGLSKDHRILFSDIVPFETGVTEEFVKKGVLDRLYYSLN